MTSSRHLLLAIAAFLVIVLTGGAVLEVLAVRPVDGQSAEMTEQE